MTLLNIILLVLIFVSYRIAIARGRRIGYNDCLRANSAAFDTQREREEKQRKLIHKAYIVGKIEGTKSLESNRQRDD